LNEKGLCDIITELGEDALCQICDDHPRYRNFYSDRTEIGLGLCCEAAAELIINNKDKMAIVTLSCDGEDDECDTEDEIFFSVRDKIFSIIQNRERSVEDRIAVLLSEFDLSMPKRTVFEWADVFLSLEMLDSEWGIMLQKLKNADASPDYTDAIACEQILCYFIYRHLADGLFDGRMDERIKLAVLGLDMITATARACRIPLVEAARFYSSEIEYSEENVEALLSVL
jgi:lysine-N-methylase